jgi:1-phosphatidylinositol-4-phosphate 5-kinase
MIISSSTIIEELCSTGSSGSLFYYTRDGKFILKTISREEYHTIKNILPAYYKHLMVYPNTLLPKYLGCYKLIKKVKKKMTFVYFIIMMNIFATTNEIHLRFDIKGSKIGRQVLKNDSPINNINELYGKYSYAFKDLDLERFNKLFYFKKSYRNTILNQLQQDSIFLKECGLNDYSLLVGIHKPSLVNNSNNNSNNNNLLNKNLDIELMDLPNERILLTEEEIDFQEKDEVVENTMNVDVLPDGGIVSEDKDEIYYLGIIDILTNYNYLKTMEYCLKAVRYCSTTMSCIPPADYQVRFINYMRNKIKSKEDQDNQINDVII